MPEINLTQTLQKNRLVFFPVPALRHGDSSIAKEESVSLEQL
jgi:hypothetical protein